MGRGQYHTPCSPFAVTVAVSVFLLQSVAVIGHPIVAEEERVLLQLAGKAGGMKAWVAAADCTQWEGVTCDTAGHVHAIDSEVLSALGINADKLVNKLPFLQPRNSNNPMDKIIDEARRVLSDRPKIMSTQTSGARTLNNQKLWEKRLQDDNVVGFWTSPTVANPKRVFVSKNGTAPRVSIDTLNGCNVSPRWAALPKGSEDRGLPSAVVALQIWNKGWSAFCSGSLISPYLVLTAAHCIYDTEENYYYTDKNHPWKVNVKLNGQSDKKYSSVLAWDSVIYDAYSYLNSWVYSLYQGSDLGVVILSKPLNSVNLKWASPQPSLVPRTNYGYAADTQDGYTIIYDVTKQRQVTGCEELSKTVLCENLSSEAGMSGGPLVNGPNSLVLAVCSGGPKTGCPNLYTGLTGYYALSDLVTYAGCKVSKVSKMSRYIYSAKC